MRSIEVDNKTKEDALLEFLGDVGYRYSNSLRFVQKFLRRRKWKLKTEQDDNLIYYVIIDKKKNLPKYYSWPIIKYEHEYDKEMKFFIEGGNGFIDIHESDVPVYEYNVKRRDFKPKQEDIRKQKKREYDFLQRRKSCALLDEYDFIHNLKEEVSNEISNKLYLSEVKYILFKDNCFYCVAKKRDKKTHGLKVFYKAYQTDLPSKEIINQVKKSEYYKWGQWGEYFIIYSSRQLTNRPNEPRHIKVLVPEDLSKIVQVTLTYYNDPQNMVDDFLKTGILDMNVIRKKYKPRDVLGSRVAIDEIEWDLSHLNIIEAKPEGTDRLTEEGGKYHILQKNNIDKVREDIIYAIELYMLRW